MSEFVEIAGRPVKVPDEVVAEGRAAVQKWYDDQTKSAPRASSPVPAARKGTEG